MPSPMEGSSREGDLFTVKHELKNGKLAASWFKLFLMQSVLFYRLSLGDTCPRRDVSWLAGKNQLSLSVGICSER